ncbi:MAG TPA: TetR/AcrR family transcriptional regulator [Pyrinomonadaceae bacterium]|nr:TetR/AcrR family transcriptional regulator [Pyrinomonadaceae bacterium]
MIESTKLDAGGRMKGGLRKEQILKTAIDLFSQKGFAGATTKEIARAAGVSEAMVFRHFATKSDLYEAILSTRECHEGLRFPWEEDEVLIAAIARKDDYAVFYRMGVNALNKQQSDVGFMRLLFYSALEEHELAERFFGEFVARIYGFIGGYIEERQRDGVFREIEPKVAVRAFLGMLIHHSINNILWDKGRNLLNISNEDAAYNFATILLQGIRA